MFCPKCGKQNLDTAKFCNACGSVLSMNNSNQSQNTTKPKNNKPTIVLVIALAALVLILAGIILWIFVIANNSGSLNTSANPEDPYNEVIYQYQVYNTYRNAVSPTNDGPGNNINNNGSKLTPNDETDATVNHYKVLQNTYPLLNISDTRPDKYILIDLDEDGVEELIITSYHNIVDIYTKDKDGSLIDFRDDFQYVKQANNSSSIRHTCLTKDNKILETNGYSSSQLILKDAKFIKQPYSASLADEIVDSSKLKDLGTTEVKITCSGTVKMMTLDERAKELGENYSVPSGGPQCVIICLDEPINDVFTRSYRYYLKKVDVRTIVVGYENYDTDNSQYNTYKNLIGQHVTVTFDAFDLTSANDVAGLVFEINLPDSAEIQ